MKKTQKSEEPTAESSSVERILIKKYPNRRLYNTATSTYIVLDDVVELVKSGTPFIIEDTKTREDITRTILNQIIFEQETKPSNFHFPLEFQKQLISMYGDSYGQMVPDYLTESLKLFAAERDQMGKAMENVLDQNTRAMMDYSRRLAQHNLDIFNRSMSLFGFPASGKSGQTKDDTPGEPDEQTIDTPSPSSDRQSELDLIQKQIDALQQRLKSLK